MIGVTKLAWMYDRSRDWAASVLTAWEEEQRRGGPVRVFRHGRVLHTTLPVVHQMMPRGKDIALYGIDESSSERRRRQSSAPREERSPRPALNGPALAGPWPQLSGVYFVRAGDFVKIGRADNIRTRLTAIQCHNPLEIELLAVHPGDGEEEHHYHELFDRFRVRGEWFRWSDAIGEVVARLRTVGFVPPRA